MCSFRNQKQCERKKSQLSSLSVEFKPTQFIFAINFDHYPSSSNYVRGVKRLIWIKKQTPQ